MIFYFVLFLHAFSDFLPFCFAFSKDPWDVSPSAKKADRTPTGSPQPPLPIPNKTRPRTQSQITPPNLTSTPPNQNRAHSPKSPKVAEVSPYRRWSEATSAPSIEEKVSNEWKSNFERSYIELEELGRGRFSVVRRCQEIMTGNELAVKFVNRRKQNEADTLREYRHLANIKNPYIISSTGLYLTSNSYAIVLSL